MKDFILVLALCFGLVASTGTGQKADSLVIYSMEGCPPCRVLEPKAKQLVKEGYKVTVRKLSDIKPGEYRPKFFPSIHFFAGKDHLGNLGVSWASPLSFFREKLEK